MGFLLAGCTTSAEPAEIAAMPPDMRFSHDYAGGYPQGPMEVNGHDIRASGQDKCLDGTAYDPYPPSKTTYYGTPGSVLVKPDGTIDVTTTTGDSAPVLHFASPADSVDANGYPKPLTPLDESTKQVLAAANCETEFYPRYKQD